MLGPADAHNLVLVHQPERVDHGAHVEEEAARTALDGPAQPRGSRALIANEDDLQSTIFQRITN
jgi:hypothetical protein